MSRRDGIKNHQQSRAHALDGISQQIEALKDEERRIEQRKKQEEADRAFALDLVRSEGSSSMNWLYDGQKPQIDPSLVAGGVPGVASFADGANRKRLSNERRASSASKRGIASADCGGDDVMIMTVIPPPSERKNTRKLSNNADMVNAVEEKSKSSLKDIDLLPYWTPCVGGGRYQLVPITGGGQEIEKVVKPLLNVNFRPVSVKRIQNKFLFKRLVGERGLMKEGRPPGFNVNEAILYHTTQVSASVIADEGLDSRLSGHGNFGFGLYFSDDPRMCNRYWRQRVSALCSSVGFCWVKERCIDTGQQYFPLQPPLCQPVFLLMVQFKKYGAV
eukprot:m.208692 g.208692  ORF g.208692 m.208692 type:complete len:332 (+) comp39713_c0_seq12:111-1106(+)